MSIFRAALGSIGSTILGTLFLLGTGVLTARVLGPEGKGAYVFAVLVPQLAVNLCVLGLTTALSYHVAKDHREAGTALGTSLAIVISLTTGCAAILGSLAWSVPEFPADVRLLSLTAWSMPASAAYSLCRFTILGLRHHRELYVLNVVDKCSLLAVLLAAWLVSAPGLRAFCLLYSVSAGIALVTAAMITLPSLGGRLRFDGVYARSALSYGLRSHVGWMAEFLNYRLDMLIVQALSGATTLGFYSVSVSIAETLWLVPNCVSAVLLPHLASGRGGGTAGPITRLLLALTLIFALFLALLGGPLITSLYGQAFRPALVPLWLLLPGVAAFSIVRPLSAQFAAQGRPGMASLGATVSLAVTLALDFALVPAFGAAGAAGASAFGYGIGAACMVLVYLRLTGGSTRGLLWVRGEDLRLLWQAVRRLPGRPSVTDVRLGAEGPP